MKKAADRIRLFHWNAAEGAERAALLEKAGYQVDARPLQRGSELKQLSASPPAAIVIDLSRAPSHGREVAMALRARKGTSAIPLLFVDGEPEKVARTRELLPDAAFGRWKGIGPALRKTIANPPVDPIRPVSALAGYSGTPLPKKLGIKGGSVVRLLRAPGGFEKLLGDLPAGARLRRAEPGECDLALWFARSLGELEREIARVAGGPWKGALWIAWPKKASGVATDLTETHVRRLGLGHGLVDYKICAIDATWSGLKFARRAARKG